jgi:type I restriction enzyme R subunit
MNSVEHTGWLLMQYGLQIRLSEMLSRAMKSYLNGMLSNEEVIAELMKMAKDMANAQAEGDAMGLTDEELAFYDALTSPEAVKDFYQNEELVAMTHELADISARTAPSTGRRKNPPVLGCVAWSKSC